MRRADVIASLTACGAALACAPVPSAAAAAGTLHTGSALEDTVRPLLWGINAGVFRRLGLTIDVDGMGSGAATTAAIVGGALDIGHSSLLTVFAAHLRGVPVKLVAQGWNYLKSDPRGGLLVRRDSPYQTGRDFNGKTFAASAIGDLKSLIIRAWVDQHGGDSKTLKFVELPASAEVAALQAGRIDGIVAFDPWIDLALASGTVRQVADPGDAIAPHYLVTGWIARTDYIASNPESIRAFYAGMRTSAAYANTHDAEMAPVLAPFFHQSVADLRKSRHLPLATALDPREIQPVIDASYKYGAIASTFPAADLIADAIR
jgi:ABC-type nitrate/sulfonate/bicarbonate transport system substrate-binding protein